ncbi:MAG: enoyl-CoA hydratase, partial [Acidimicrobiales bacterium]|nr:enoyl-CoA hydratase [Acidimicrobiales bacterium]
MTEPTIRSEVRPEGVAVVTLDAPERRNAFDLAMCDEVVDTFDRLEADDAVGAVVVTGAGSAFCAGADLSHLGDAQREGLLAVYEGFLRVARSPLPTIAAVNGPAVGAGMNLALACDVRLVGRSGRFDTRFLQLGIHPGGGHTWMLRRLVGPQAAAALVLFGEVVAGDDAVAAGLAWRCVEDDELVDAAVAMAARAAAAPTELATRIKATLADVAAIDLHAEAVERELGDQVWSIGQPAFAERLAALQA